MNRHPWRALAAALAAACARPCRSSGLAAGLLDRGAGQPKVAGASPANVLSPAAQRDRRRVGRARTRRCHQRRAVLRLRRLHRADRAHAVHQRGAQDRARQEHVPGPRAGPAGRRPEYDYGTHFLFQGHESGTPGATHAHQPRRRPGPSRDAALDDGRHARRDRRLDLGSVRTAPALHRRERQQGRRLRGDAGLPVAGVRTSRARSGAAATRASRPTTTATSGSWRTSAAATAPPSTHAKQPNSFVYRFVPDDPSDLSDGKLQALQVISNQSGNPIAFHAGQAEADIKSADTRDLHTPGEEFKTRWVTIHDTAATARRRSTPTRSRRRPRRRRSNARRTASSSLGSLPAFFFTETGDTNSLTEAGAAYGGFGSSAGALPARPVGDDRTPARGVPGRRGAHGHRQHRVRQPPPGGCGRGRRRWAAHPAQRPGFGLPARRDRVPAGTPVRFLAEGRDPSATFDAEHSGHGQNEGDNEITGIHVSDGDPSVSGLLGAAVPTPVQQWLAHVLDPAARRQRHVRGGTRPVAGCSHPSKAPPSCRRRG